MIRIILISSVIPAESTAGQVILQRHLVDQPAIDLQIFHTEPQKKGLARLLRRFLGRLNRTIFSTYSQDICALWNSRFLDKELPESDSSAKSTVVMTVAHGEACYAAARYAKRHGLPLLTIFHDWWPDIADVHKPLRSVLQRSFIQLYRDSSFALCVSDGMKRELGPHDHAEVLFPIPAQNHSSREAGQSVSGSKFKIIYAGNLREYGPMLMSALDELKDHPDVRLEVRGNSSSWPDSIREEMTERGLLLPFVQREELTEWLKSADAFLITQSFSEADARLMRTNFPSKLPEFSQFGKPLVMWGPDYASGSIWSRNTGHALLVEHRGSQYLRQALENLIASNAQQERFAKAAQEAAEGCFNPERIQSDFLQCVNDCSS